MSIFHRQEHSADMSGTASSFSFVDHTPQIVELGGAINGAAEPPSTISFARTLPPLNAAPQPPLNAAPQPIVRERKKISELVTPPRGAFAALHDEGEQKEGERKSREGGGEEGLRPLLDVPGAVLGWNPVGKEGLRQLLDVPGAAPGWNPVDLQKMPQEAPVTEFVKRRYEVPSRPPKSQDGRSREKDKMQALDKMSQEMQEIKARTMFGMIDEVIDATGGDAKKLVFLTNRQANLFTAENINKLIEAFDIKPPKLVIRLMSIGAGPQSRAFGMVNAFKYVKRDSTYEEEWKKVLRIQSENNPNTGMTQDQLPDPPFLEDRESDQAQWSLESFMREVLVPLAAENNALVIGSAFRDDEMMSSFAKVAKQLDAKYGGVGVSPWTLFGVADAPSLIFSVLDPNSIASQFHAVSSTWQQRFENICEAKYKDELHRKATVGKALRAEQASTAEARLEALNKDMDYQIQYDLNPKLACIIVVDCVKEKHGEVTGIDSQPLDVLNMSIIEHVCSKYTCMAVGTMHSEAGYAGMQKVGGWMHLGMPVLLLDIRDRQSCRTPPDYAHPHTLEQARDLFDKCCGIDTSIASFVEQEAIHDELERAVTGIFELVRRHDEQTTKELILRGRADVYEVARVAFFHSRLKMQAAGASGAGGGGRVPVPLYKMILEKEELLKAASESMALKFATALMNRITEWCTSQEFVNYWALKSAQEKKEIEVSQGLTNFREFYMQDMCAARTAYHIALTNKLLYSAHVKDTELLRYLVNNVMMDRDSLPTSNTLEGLLVLRQAWDIVDIGAYVLRKYKIAGKGAFATLLLVSIAITVVNIQKDDIDRSIPEKQYGRTVSELVTFGLALATSFVTAVTALMKPISRWQQIRDAVAGLESEIWHFRTRTGKYEHQAGNEAGPVLQLKASVLQCREQILKSADVQGTSFYKIYPASIFRHNQRIPREQDRKQKTRIDPGEKKQNLDDKVLLDVEDPASLKEGAVDDHHSPLRPDNYLRLRLYPVMAFYRKRLPRYSRAREVYSVLLLIGTALGAVLAFVGYAPQVAIITAITSAIMSWMEFASTSRKISRYNASVVAIEDLILWWDSLGLVEKASPVNVKALTHGGEAIINAERSSWMSAPKSDKEDKNTDKEKDKDEKKAS